jgi:hypothetical protein
VNTRAKQGFVRVDVANPGYLVLAEQQGLYRLAPRPGKVCKGCNREFRPQRLDPQPGREIPRQRAFSNHTDNGAKPARVTKQNARTARQLHTRACVGLVATGVGALPAEKVTGHTQVHN